MRPTSRATQPRRAAGSRTLSALIPALKAALGDEVAEVRASRRLVDSAVVLPASSAGPDLQMQRLLRRSGRAMPSPPPVLEINPAPPPDPGSRGRRAKQELIADAARTLLDLARVQEGDLPPDPAAFARRVTGLLARGLG